MSRNGGCCGSGSSGNGGCCGGGSSGNGGIAGGPGVTDFFFSTTVTTLSDSSLVSRPLRCKMKCFVVRTNLKKKTQDNLRNADVFLCARDVRRELYGFRFAMLKNE